MQKMVKVEVSLFETIKDGETYEDVERRILDKVESMGVELYGWKETKVFETKGGDVIG